MTRKDVLYIFLVLVPLSVGAQHVSSNLPLPAVSQKSGNLFAIAKDGAKGKPALLQPLYWVKTLIDSSAVATIDRDYIEQPTRAWSVELRNEFSENTLKMTTVYPMKHGLVGDLVVRSSTGVGVSTGLWAGYRGYGFGWSKSLKGEGSTFSFGAMGGSFGLNLRIINYRSQSPESTLTLRGSLRSYKESGREELEDPIKIRSLFLDGYYMFNGKHFSYAAAYDQSLIQRRSAGSLMAGGMYYHSRVAYDDASNWPIIAFMRGVGQIKFTQASVGVGYAYNWVPAKGWLISAQAMPMLQFYNRMKTYVYGINYKYFDGKDNYSLNLVDLVENNLEDMLINESAEGDEEDFDDLNDDFVVIGKEEEYKTSNKIGLNFDARLAVVYNLKNFYFRVYGHYNRFRYSNDTGHGRMAEWRAYASLGYRF